MPDRRQPAPGVYPAGAQAAMLALGKLHRYAAQRADGALAAAQRLAQRTKPVTAAQLVALHQLRQEFLRALLLSVQAAGDTLINGLGHDLPGPQLAAGERQRIDQLVTWYVQQVRMILRS